MKTTDYNIIHRITHILILDDNEDMRNRLSEILKDCGYKIWPTEKIKTAFQLTNQMSFDVIIIDLKTSGKNGDGISLIKQFKQSCPNAAIIVIAADTTVENAVKAMKEGAYDYFTKPFNTEQIKLVVNKAVERQFLWQEAKEKEKYRELSIIDGLTEIYNHRYFHELLNREMDRVQRYPRPLSLLMIDIDNFKKYNDTYGHLSGDRVLREMSQIFNKLTRKVDYVARYGGEEFAIILPETNKKDAYIMASRIQNRIDQTRFTSEGEAAPIHLTISVGLATYPDDASTKNDLLIKADRALYKAKEMGKNCVSFAKPSPQD